MQTCPLTVAQTLACLAIWSCQWVQVSPAVTEMEHLEKSNTGIPDIFWGAAHPSPSPQLAQQCWDESSVDRMQSRQLPKEIRMTMKPLVKEKVITYTVCGGDNDRTGDEWQAIVHADLECSFPAKTREREVLSMVCLGPGSLHNYPWDCSLVPWRPELSPLQNVEHGF